MDRRRAPWERLESRARRFAHEEWHSMVSRGLSLVAVFGAGRFGASKLVAEGELHTRSKTEQTTAGQRPDSGVLSVKTFCMNRFPLCSVNCGKSMVRWPGYSRERLSVASRKSSTALVAASFPVASRVALLYRNQPISKAFCTLLLYSLTKYQFGTERMIISLRFIEIAIENAMQSVHTVQQQLDRVEAG